MILHSKQSCKAKFKNDKDFQIKGIESLPQTLLF